MTDRILMGGFADLEGSVVNDIIIGDIACRAPLMWECKCQLCGTVWRESHVIIQQQAEDRQCRSKDCMKRRELERHYMTGQRVRPREAVQRTVQEALPPAPSAGTASWDRGR